MGSRVPSTDRRLADAGWPGPLTLVLPRAPHASDAITGGLDTVALRVPDQPVARALLLAFGGGVAAPSANRFGRVSPTTATDVVADLGDSLRAGVDVVLDGGPCRVGVESTIVDCARLDQPGARPAILRVGGISRERVEELLGYAVDVRTGGETRAPGTLASHYAPNARVVVVADEELSSRASAEIAAGRRVGVLASKVPDFLDDAVVVIGTPADADEYARTLYRCLRDADARALDVVLAVAPAEVGIGAAVADRLRRAAGAGASAMTGPIGVFDSGLGGLTVLRALIDLLPDEPVVYFGDNGRFPYGPKPRDEVLKHALEISDVLMGYDAKLLVVACNSAAAAALDVLEAQLDVPVVGVIEPGLRAAIDATRTGRIGVIGTVGTIASGAYQRLAATNRGPAGVPVELTCAACPGFVEFVEAGDVDSDQVHVLAERLLAPVIEAGVDTLVLGCTHYPLLARTIGDVMGRMWCSCRAPTRPRSRCGPCWPKPVPAQPLAPARRTILSDRTTCS